MRIIEILRNENVVCPLLEKAMQLVKKNSLYSAMLVIGLAVSGCAVPPKDEIEQRPEDGFEVMGLILGHSTLKEATELYPRGRGPRTLLRSRQSWLPDSVSALLSGAKPPSWLPEEILKTWKERKYEYRPPADNLVILSFNRKKKLIVYREYVPDEKAESISRNIDSRVELDELYRNIDHEGDGEFVKHAKLGDCVTLHAQYEFLWGTLGSADKVKLRACEEDVNASRYEKGISCLKNILNNAQDSGQAQYDLGLAYLWSGDEINAKKQLETLKRMKEVGLAMNLLTNIHRDRPEWIDASSAAEERKEMEDIVPNGILQSITYYYTCPTE